METPLRVLIIEDSEEDALLLIHHLKKGGYNPSYRRVDTADDLRQALHDETWDVIFCDYQMPRFDAPRALQVFQEHHLDLPFIVVSGKIGEDIAVDMMKRGAHDYLLKNNLARLVPAVRRELHDAEVRREHKWAKEEKNRIEQELYFSEQRYQNLFDSAGDVILIHEPDGKIIDANRAACARLGYAKEELSTMNLRDLLTPEEAARLPERLADLGRNGQAIFESALLARDGTIQAMEISNSLIVYPTRMVIFTIARDITRRNRMEADLSALEERYRCVFDGLTVAVVLSDPGSGSVIDFNRVAAELLGISREEGAARGLDLFCQAGPPHTADELLRILRLAAAEGPRALSWETFDRSRRRLSCLLKLNPVVVGGKSLVVVTVVPRA